MRKQASRKEDGMRTVTPGAPRLEVTPLAHGTWPSGGDCGPVDEQAAMEAIGGASPPDINFFGTAQAYRSGHVTEMRAARC
jgi:aryl-alcohol dehydrogenase-like predicted oxidoreductase